MLRLMQMPMRKKVGQSMSRDEYPGILFLIDMDNRQIYMATQGTGPMNYYDDYRIPIKCWIIAIITSQMAIIRAPAMLS